MESFDNSTRIVFIHGVTCVAGNMSEIMRFSYFALFFMFLQCPPETLGVIVFCFMNSLLICLIKKVGNSSRISDGCRWFLDCCMARYHSALKISLARYFLWSGMETAYFTLCLHLEVLDLSFIPLKTKVRSNGVGS